MAARCAGLGQCLLGRLRPEGLAALIEQLHLVRLDGLVGGPGRNVVDLEAGDQPIDADIKLRALLGASRDDQRCARFVDQNRVDLVHDREGQWSLHAVGGAEREIIPQIVEAELVVRPVGDVGCVCGSLLVRGLAAADDADLETEKAIDRSHPFGVDRDDVHATAGQRVEIGGKRRDERLALAGSHLGDLTLVQNHATDQLHIEVAHLDRTSRGFAHERERLGNEIVEIAVLCEALLELGRLVAERRVVECGDRFLELVGGCDEPSVALEQSLIAATEDAGQEIRKDGGQCKSSSARVETRYFKEMGRVWAALKGPKAVFLFRDAANGCRSMQTGNAV